VAGINEEGRREILTWRMADVESEATWGCLAPAGNGLLNCS